MRRVLAAGAVLAASATAAIAATFPAPSLTLDSSFSPPTGIARIDVIDQVTGNPGANAVDGDRLYTVGGAGSGPSGDVGVIAQRLDGTPDPAFSEDGRLAIAASSSEDRAVDVVVLPDRSIRILALSAGATKVIGRLSDGTPDLAFGAADGTADGMVAITGLGPSALALAGDGRLAVTGATGSGDTAVAVLNADGTPAPTFGDATGVVTFDRSGDGTADGGFDIAFRPGGGVMVFGQFSSAGGSAVYLRAFTDLGAADPAFSEDGDLVAAVGDVPAVAGAMIVHAGRFWLTGSTRAGADTNAYLARVEGDGTGLQSRQFDMRGQLIDPAQAVTSVGDALTVVPGIPDTLVVSGSVASASGTDWAAAAFNNVDGDLASASFVDVAISVPGSGGITGLAAGPGQSAFVSGPYQETVTTPSSSITYTRFGIARLLVDAEKACDLAVTVPSPLELVLRPGVPGSVDVKVTNGGTRACAGVVSVPEPYAMTRDGITGPIATGTLAPGESFTATNVALSYGGALRREDTLAFTLTAPGDASLMNNTDTLGVRFRFCDLALSLRGARSFMPSEGSRRFPFLVRNDGTSGCSGVRIAVTGGARPASRPAPYAIDAGRDVSDRPAVRLRAPAKPGQRLLVSFRVADGDDTALTPGNDAVLLAPVVLGVGDTDARRPRGSARTLRGTARGGRGPASRRLRAVKRVDVAVRRVGTGCRWLASAEGRRFRSLKPGSRDRCTRPVWLKTKGTRAWRLKTEGLPPGTYELLSRATIRAGFREASFTLKDGNRVRFSVRR